MGTIERNIGNLHDLSTGLLTGYKNPVTGKEESLDAAAIQSLVSGDGNGNTVVVGVKWASGDMSTAIQAAIDAVWTVSPYGGAVVLSDAAIYVAQGLVMRPRVSLRGIGTTFSEVYVGQTSAPDVAEAINCTVLRLADGATTPLLRNDTEHGYDRAGSNVFTDGTVTQLRQHYMSATIEGIFFDGNAQNQVQATSLLYFERAWALYLRNCNIINSLGFGLELADCNAVQIDNVWSHYAPWFFFDVADTQVRSCTVSGSVRWGTSVWLHGSACALNQFSNNLFYNSSLNTEAQWTNPTDTATLRILRNITAVTGTTGATDTVFTCDSHKLYDEMPVMLSSTGSLPTGMYADRVYWVKRLGGNDFKLAENRNRGRFNIFVQASSAGSGTISVYKGPAANLALTGGASKNQVNGGRIDQSYGDGILCLGSPGNAFNVSISQAGLGSTTARAGVRLRAGYIETQPPTTVLQGSYGTVLQGIADGIATVYNGLNSNQTIGVICDDTASEANVNTVGLNSINHATAGYSPSHIGVRRTYRRQTNVPAIRTAVGAAADQTTTVLATLTVPGKAGGALGKNGRMLISARMSANNTVAREFQVFVNGGSAGPLLAMANLSFDFRDHCIYANNASSGANSIKVWPTSAINTASGVAATLGTVDMTTDFTVEIRGRWTSAAAASDTLTVESLTVEVIESD